VRRERPQRGALVALVVRLYDPDLDPAWLPALAPVSRALVTAVGTARGIPVADAWLADLDDVHALLGGGRVTSVLPGHLEAPLTSYHLQGRILADRGRATPYPAVAALIHVNMRMLERGMVDRLSEFGQKLSRNVWDYGRSARLMSRYGPPATASLEGELRAALVAPGHRTAAARNALIEITITRWREAETVASRTVDKRRVHLAALLGLRPHVIQPVNSATRRQPRRDRESSLLPGGPADEAEERVMFVADGMVATTLPEEALAEGETVADYLELLDPVEPATGLPVVATVARHPRRRREGDHDIMRRLGFLHDPSTAQPFELARVYEVLLDRPVALMNPARLREALHGLLLLYYGVPPKVLATARVARDQPPEGTTFALDLEAERIWIPLPTIATGIRADPRALELSRPGSEWASVPLLPILARLVRRLRKVFPTAALAPGMPVFGGDGRIRAVAALGGACQEPGALARLARGTRRWLAHHDLPPVLVATVSTRFGFETRATAAYANLSEGWLGHAHAAATAGLHHALLAECARRGRRFPHLEDSALFEVSGVDGRRFGSRLVPLVAPLREAVRALEARVRPIDRGAPLEELCHRFSVVAVYELLRLSWTAALRPRRDPSVTRGRVDATGGWLLVEDKDSPFFAECRPVPLPEEATHRLVRLAEVGDAVRARLRMAGQPVEIPDDVLFFRSRPVAPFPLTQLGSGMCLLWRGLPTDSRGP